MARKLIVEIVGDSRSYERALGRSSKATEHFGISVDKTTKASQGLRGILSTTGGAGGFLFGSGTFVAAALAAGAITKSIGATSDLNEQLSRTEVVLGDSSAAMVKWSETTASSIGISQRAALAAVGTFAGLFQTVGLGQEKAGDLSRSLVKLAADLASLQNTSPEEALIALRSGLAGEAEPLRRFNIFLTEARVQQEAMAESGKSNVKALTQQEKTLARFNLIMQDSVLAQGNFALTSKGLANQQRILAAQVDDLSTKLGTVLVPAATALVGALNDAVGAGEDLATVLGKLANIPGIEIPVKLVSEFGGGNAGFILRHIVLGGISPLALGITIGKEIADGIRDGAALDPGVVLVRPSPDTRDAADAARQRQATAANVRAGQAVIEQVTRQANAQKSLNQQIAESETRAAHLRELILQDPGNVKLQQRLAAEIKKQNDLAKEQVALNKSNAAAVQATAAAHKAAAEEAAAARREAERAAAEARRNATKARQFKALGLTPEGLRPTPGSGALLSRALGLEKQIKGTVLDTPKVNAQLKKIVNFLKKNFGKAGKDVREAILSMLNDISGAMKDGAKKTLDEGPLTKTHGLNTRKLAEGLGLTPEQERELRQRASKFNTAGRALGGSTNAPGGGGGARLTRAGFGPIAVESFVTVNIDGHKVTSVVTRGQQKAKRRNPQQKRGQHRG